MNKKPDILIRDEGTIVLFTPSSRRAQKWVKENVQTESWQWMGRSSFAVDHRFAQDLISGMEADGLTFGAN